MGDYPDMPPKKGSTKAIPKSIIDAQKKRKDEKEARKEKDLKDLEKEEQKEKERKANELTPGVIVMNALITAVFASMPYSEGDMNGSILIVVINVAWTLLLHRNTWIDYGALVALNILLGLYAKEIITNSHKVPGLLPPEQWAIFITVNGG